MFRGHSDAKWHKQTRQGVGVAVTAEKVGCVRLDRSEGLLGDHRLGVRVDARPVKGPVVEAGHAHRGGHLEIGKLFNWQVIIKNTSTISLNGPRDKAPGSSNSRAFASQLSTGNRQLKSSQPATDDFKSATSR